MSFHIDRFHVDRCKKTVTSPPISILFPHHENPNEAQPHSLGLFPLNIEGLLCKCKKDRSSSTSTCVMRLVPQAIFS